ncbi:MAG: hypothetical protein Ta2E_08000 [Mycoplasmoidaceae bacterium]|nr:MAG: hypothetical protein Ta2E_08000 [Mycoplasmoidaceae bacterium]
MLYKNKQIELLHNKYVEAIFQIAQIEDKGITFPKTFEIVNDLEKAENEIPKKQIDIVLGIKRAYEYVIELANSSEPITTRDLQSINRYIDEYESSTKAGEWRKWEVGISATKYTPPTHPHYHYTQLFYSFFKDDNYTFASICKLCGLITKLQPFNNGNKRTAICFCNALLVKKNIIPIQIIDYVEYIEKLIAYYNDESKINDYVKFLMEQSHYNQNEQHETREEKILNIIKSTPNINKIKIAYLLNVSEPTISRTIASLIKSGKLGSKTSNKSGKWIIK